MADTMSIAVVGSGYVGTVVAACFARLGHDVVGVEIDPEKLSTLQSGGIHFFEPGLEELVSSGVEAGNLRFTDDFDDAVGRSELIFLCVGTPSAEDGEPDLTAMETAARTIAKSVRAGHVIITKSTVPIGNGPWLREVIEKALGPDRTPHFSVVSNPEFLREGSAVHDFLYPDRVVIGSNDDIGFERVAAAYAPILDQEIDHARTHQAPALVRTDLTTAETIKYAANAFLATKISFINEIASFCERAGADVTEVSRAIGLDSRVSDQFLDAGIGWGGSCFGKDLAGLTAAARKTGMKPRLLEAVQQVNEDQRGVVLDKLRQRLGQLDGHHIAVLGLSFKPGTDDLRDSPAVDVVRRLLSAGATVTAHDPLVETVSELPELITHAEAYDAAVGAEAIVVATDWPDFNDIDLAKLRDVMSGQLFIDGRNMFDPEAVAAEGFIYEGIGRNPILPSE